MKLCLEPGQHIQNRRISPLFLAANQHRHTTTSAVLGGSTVLANWTFYGVSIRIAYAVD